MNLRSDSELSIVRKPAENLHRFYMYAFRTMYDTIMHNACNDARYAQQMTGSMSLVYRIRGQKITKNERR